MIEIKYLSHKESNDLLVAENQELKRLNKEMLSCLKIIYQYGSLKGSTAIDELIRDIENKTETEIQDIPSLCTQIGCSGVNPNKCPGNENCDIIRKVTR